MLPAIRLTSRQDIDKILELYQIVAGSDNGLARTSEEFSLEFVSDFLTNSWANGLSLVGEIEGKIIAEIHGFKMQTKCFSHCLSNLIIAVHPNYHGQGIGRKIFEEFLLKIRKNHLQISRVELMVCSTNLKAISLYKSLGFMVEGVLKNRIKNSDSSFADDLMMGLLIYAP